MNDYRIQMNMTPFMSRLSGWSMIIVLMVAPQALARDTILLKKKKGRSSSILGDISETSVNEIQITTSGTIRKVPVNEIRRVSFAGEPGQLKSARAAAQSGQYEQAMGYIEQIVDENRVSALVRQEIEFYRAYVPGQLAILGTGDASASIQQLLSFVKKNRNNFHFYEAARLLGDLSMSLGDFSGASRYYSAYAKAPFDDYKLEGMLLEANSLKASSDLKGAKSKYEQVVKQAGNDADSVRLRTLAEVGIAACSALAGDADSSIKTLQTIIQENDASDTELFANAYLAMGTAYAKADKPRDAVLAFLHVDLMFYTERDAHAEALYHLSSLWNEINKPERAVQSRKTLMERYGGTIWANRS